MYYFESYRAHLLPLKHDQDGGLWFVDLEQQQQRIKINFQDEEVGRNRLSTTWASQWPGMAAELNVHNPVIGPRPINLEETQAGTWMLEDIVHTYATC